jgi:RecB family exonuclease
VSRIVVVPTERHVERLGRAGVRGETRAGLRERLVRALAPEVEWATEEAARLALAVALGGDCEAAPLLFAALGALFTSATSEGALARAEKRGGLVGRRAKLLLRALRGQSAELARARLVDVRHEGIVLARAIAEAGADRVREALGADAVVARFFVAWDGADVAWWRELDATLARSGGARIELPAFDRPLDSTRARDALEILAEDLARALDDAPLTVPIDAPLGNLTLLAAPPPRARAIVEVRAAADAEAQARAVADAVQGALAGGVAVEEICVALPRADEETLGPIRRALDEAGIALHEASRPATRAIGIAAAATGALAIGARGLPRVEVDRLLRSRYIDARALAGSDDASDAAHDAERVVLDLARALEVTATKAGLDPLASLVDTARAAGGERAESRATFARKVGEILLAPHSATTRREHLAAARAVWSGLGLDVRPGAGARARLAQDGRVSGIARAELQALGRDACAWEALLAAMAAYEAALVRLGLGDTRAPAEALHRELACALERGAPLPASSRAGAVRIVRLSEAAAEPLALLVVADASEGVLPCEPRADPLLSSALVAALREIESARAPPSLALLRARETASFALAVANASRIVLTYRTADREGAALAPSPVVASLVRAGVPVSTWSASGAALRPSTAEDARRAATERAREELFYDAARVAGPVHGQIDVHAGNPDLSRALADETGDVAHPLAVTALERIARCPFQGYAAAVLGARERRRHRDLPDAREEGTLVHEALAAAFRATAPLWRVHPRDSEVIVDGALTAARIALGCERAASALRRIALDRALADVRAVVEWSLTDDGWDFALAEQAFGDDVPGAWPALLLEHAGTALHLRGRIDRVDRAPGGGVRVVDYKRSKRRALDVAGLGVTDLQVPLYARAAAGHLGASYASGLYLPTGARDLPGFEPRDAFPVRWSELLEEDGGLARIERRALDLVRALREGALAPLPDDERACTICPFDGGCRRPRFAIPPADEF